jgi:glycine cleavage system H protein
VDEPALVNREAASGGWFFKMTLTDESSFAALMDETAYAAFVEEA